MRKSILLTLILFLFCLYAYSGQNTNVNPSSTTTAQSSQNPAQNSSQDDTENIRNSSNFIIATVDEEAIFINEVKDRFVALVASNKQQKKPVPSYNHETKKMLLNILIDETILLVYAKRNHVEVSEAQVTKQINDIKSQYRLENDDEVIVIANNAGVFGYVENVNELRDKLFRGMLIHQAKQHLLNEVLRGKLKEPTETEKKQFYSQHPQYFYGPESIKLQHFVIKIPENADFDQLEKFDKTLKAVFSQAKSGANFTSLINKYADQTYRSNNGFVSNQFLKRSELQILFPKYVEKAFALRQGEISDIITDGNKKIILKVVEKKLRQLKKYEEVSETIRQILMSQQGEQLVNEWTEGQKRERIIKIYEDRLRVAE